MNILSIGFNPVTIPCTCQRPGAALMSGLRRALGKPVEPVEVAGWNGDLLEAELFGYLAVRSTLALPLSLPSTTGVPAPMQGGRFWRAGR